MMAAGVLKGSGLDDAERSKAKEAWLDLPGNSNITAKTGLTRRQMLQLEQLAAARKTTVNELIDSEFAKLVVDFLKNEVP